MPSIATKIKTKQIELNVMFEFLERGTGFHIIHICINLKAIYGNIFFCVTAFSPNVHGFSSR
jgi:hypothetical protein